MSQNANALIGFIFCWLWSSGSLSNGAEGMLTLELTTPAREKVEQFGQFSLDFTLSGGRGNPYDPADYDVRLDVEGPGGRHISHSAYFSADHQVSILHGHEVMRPTGTDRWRVKWTPDVAGPHKWTLVAESNGMIARLGGVLHCDANGSRGFVRIARRDPKYLEFSNGEFFYPIGHHLRSPEDDRWSRGQVKSAAELTHKTEKYDRWFRKMKENGENFCEIWMCPWWLGLEWTRTHPGYDGIGRYNQIHAAQLDRIMELAQFHGIYVMLYTMCHGQLSTVIDAQWQNNPWRIDAKSGAVSSPEKILQNPEFKRGYENQLRYVLARWGHSRALFGIVLTSEIEWIDPYEGTEASVDSEVVNGSAVHRTTIRRDPKGVESWFADIARFVSRLDVHRHIVTIQRNRLTEDFQTWSNPLNAMILSNAYQDQISSSLITVKLGQTAEGTADGILGWAMHFKDYPPKPRMIAEWGGHHLQNPPGILEAELHIGIWSMAMTDTAGVTGFWWWNEIDNADLYPHFRALHQFLIGIDRRGKRLLSGRCDVRFQVKDISAKGEVTSLFVRHPTRNGTALSNANEAFAYIYHDQMNRAGQYSSSKDSQLFPLAKATYWVLPETLVDGNYGLEFWDTTTGEIFSTEQRQVSIDNLETRRIALPEHRGDIAVKVKPVRKQ